jgi:hypothetical protein
MASKLQDLQAYPCFGNSEINSLLHEAIRTTAATKEIFSFHCLRFIN